MPAPRFSPSIPLLYALAALSVFALTRIGLAVWTGLDAVPLADWPAVLAKGLWFDLAVLAVLLAPVWLYEALLPARWRAHGAHRALRLAWFALTVFALLFGAVAETTFWLEFATRFNFIAVDYLLYTHEVIGNIRESYPVPWIVGGLALAALAVTLAIRPWLRRADRQPLSRPRRFAYVAAAILVPVAAITAASVDQMGTIGNAYADDSERVPSSMGEALEAWESSEWIRATFGQEVQDHYSNMARIELADYGRTVTDWERYRSFERL